MTQIKNDIDNTFVPDKCESLWGRNPCPNNPKFLVITKHAVGFAVMCRPHKEGFLQTASHGNRLLEGDHIADYTVELYTIERARELQELVQLASTDSGLLSF
jgi:hypothetical protein